MALNVKKISEIQKTRFKNQFLSSEKIILETMKIMSKVPIQKFLKYKNLNLNMRLEIKKYSKVFLIIPINKISEKILLLDLKETFIHADFNGEYINNKTIKYDKIIKFKENEYDFEENNEEFVKKEE